MRKQMIPLSDFRIVANAAAARGPQVDQAVKQLVSHDDVLTARREIRQWPEYRPTRLAKLEGTENRIAVARRRFIQQVADYNTLVRVFPSNLTAMVIGAETKPTFEARAGAEQAPEVQF